MRLINLLAAAALVLAAAYVYKIKFAATVEAEQVTKLRTEIARERDAIAALRAKAATLENPARIQALAERHLALKLLDPAQIAKADEIPFPSEDATRPASDDPTSTGTRLRIDPGMMATGSVVPRPRPRPRLR